MQGNVHVEGKKSILILGVVLLLQCLVIVAWGTQKERMHVDEMFTMEGVKKEGAGKRYWDLDEDFYGTEHNREEFYERLIVDEDNLIIKEGIKHVANRLMHGNFYYVLINLLVSISPGHMPWTICIGFNLLCFLVTQIILYRIAKEDFGDICALFTTVIYGFSAGGISTVLYARCYMMLAMLEILLIYVFHRFVKAKKIWQRILCMIGSAALAFCAYRTHQFGTILSALIIGIAVLNMVVKKKWKELVWLCGGYGIFCLMGYRLIFRGLRDFLIGRVAKMFYEHLMSTPAPLRIHYVGELLRTVGNHMFGNIWIMLLAIVIISIYFVRIKIWSQDSALKEKSVALGLLMIVALFYLILVFGGAISWRYFSPVYPIVALLLGITVSLAYVNSDTQKGQKFAILSVVICIPIISYGMRNVSEMYTGEEALREELEANYHGVNGIMVHHDVRGDGENWLYEAATLWPEESEVLVLQHHMILEDGLFECRNDDRILLWLTADFDRDESISLFKECTDYKEFELIVNTDHVWVYECWK